MAVRAEYEVVSLYSSERNRLEKEDLPVLVEKIKNKYGLNGKLLWVEFTEEIKEGMWNIIAEGKRAKEEISLGKDGDESNNLYYLSLAVAEIILQANEGLVVNAVNIWGDSSGTEEELKQQARQGLFKAIWMFESDRGIKFSTCAMVMMRAALQKFPGWFAGINKYKKQLYGLAVEAEKRLTKEFGRKPLFGEIANDLGISEAKIRSALEIKNFRVFYAEEEFCFLGSEISLWQEHFTEKGLDKREVEEEVIQKNNPIYFRQTLLDLINHSQNVFNTRELWVLKLCFGLRDGRALDTIGIGKRLGVTHQRISQVLPEALEKLKKEIEAKGFTLRDFVE